MERKFVFTGPVGAGKTTAIATISEIPVVSTEADATDDVVKLKANTTVALDYGVITLGDGVKVHLYGTPGQKRFSYMWELLGEGSMGVAVFVDNRSPTAIENMFFYLDSFKEALRDNDSVVVVGVTHMDVSPQPSLGSYQAALAERGLNIPVFEVDPRRKDDVRSMLMCMVAQMGFAERQPQRAMYCN